MIIFDTNVVSEPMRERPDADVRAWINRCTPSDVYVTAITIAELRLGAARLLQGVRRSGIKKKAVLPAVKNKSIKPKTKIVKSKIKHGKI